MSAAMDRVHRWLDEAKAEFEHLLGHADSDVKNAAQAAVEKIDAVKGELAADAPKLEAEAEQDAADVAHTAETQGIAPAEREAVADGTALIVDAGHDVAAAVEGPAKTETAPVETPAPEATNSPTA